MKRKCLKLITSSDKKRSIYIDEEAKEEILSFITQDERYKDKFRFISTIILRGLSNPCYGSEAINSKTKAVTAMKFFKGQENYRIYCKELNTSSGVKVVIAAILHQKKVEKLSNAEKNIINKIGGFEYEI